MPQSLAKVLNFHGQSGNGVLSVNESNIATVRRSIAHQAELDKPLSVRQELRKCERHGVKLDERYAWD